MLIGAVRDARPAQAGRPPAWPPLYVVGRDSAQQWRARLRTLGFFGTIESDCNHPDAVKLSRIGAQTKSPKSHEAISGLMSEYQANSEPACGHGQP